MFKSLIAYRLPRRWAITSQALNEVLAAFAFTPCTSLEPTRAGWVPTVENGDLVHSVNGQFILTYFTEKKLLPSSVINEFTKARAAEIEEQQGFKPGRKQMKEIKEEVTDTLLPRAFSINSKIKVWIDPVNGWLGFDASSTAKADAVLKYLVKSIDKLPLQGLQTQQSPLSAMTEWLASDQAPQGFTVDQDAELRSSGEGKATVRYARHTLEAADLRRHIAAGKQCTQLALTWSDRISFVLTEAMIIKRIAPLDVLKETNAPDAKDEIERFNGDVVMMAGEFNRMLTDLTEALGGMVEEAKAA